MRKEWHFDKACLVKALLYSVPASLVQWQLSHEL